MIFFLIMIIDLIVLPTGFPILLANFDVHHFRVVGWFNAAVGVTLILLEVMMFHGEYKCSHSATLTLKLIISHVNDAQKRGREFFLESFVSTTQVNSVN